MIVLIIVLISEIYNTVFDRSGAKFTLDLRQYVYGCKNWKLNGDIHLSDIVLKTDCLNKMIRKIILGIIGVGYVSARVGFFGTKTIELQDVKNERKFPTIENRNYILFHKYRFWEDEWGGINYLWGEISLRPVKVIHYDSENNRTEYI